MKVSILIATYKRAESLYETLLSFSRLAARGRWEVLVVDNAGDEKTKKTVRNFAAKLHVHYHVEKRRGKNIALNAAISKAKGDIFIFTDDDIIVKEDWLKEIREGVNRWPQYSVFGGRVRPYNPELIPGEYKSLESYPYLFGVADWDIPEGEYGYDKVFGPNMVIRSAIFQKGYRFDERVGPGSGNYIAGGETDFLQRLYKDGYKPVYLPKAVVYHRIRPEQCDWKWILNRAFRGGRSLAWRGRNESSVFIFGVPRYVYRAYAGTLGSWFWSLFFNTGRLKELRYNINKFHGIFYQCLMMKKEMRRFREVNRLRQADR
ncbi:MAG: glycosyltransferase family 2 protein [Candidatus Omnitrophota bacterium]